MAIPHDEIGKALDKVWRFYCKERSAALNRARVRGLGGGALCEHCGDLTMKPEIDHVISRGIKPGSKNDDGTATWGAYIDRLFCNAGGLHVLCNFCHRAKTKEDRKKMGIGK